MTAARAVAAFAHEARRSLALSALRRHVDARAPVVLLGQARPALDELVHDLTRERGATFGVHKKTLVGYATELALASLSERGLTPATPLALAAVARLVAREHHAARTQAGPRRLREVAAMPGFPSVLTATLEELEGALLSPEQAEVHDPELASLWRAYRAKKAASGLASRAEILAAARIHAAVHPLASLPLVALDVRLDTAAERELFRALLAAAPESLTLVPARDRRATFALEELGVEVAEAEETDPLSEARAALFASPAEISAQPGRIHVRSAPGEALEATEVAREILEQAGRGVRFDEMAVVVRQRELYAAHLTSAFARAQIPAHFEVGTRRPHPAGRALLALLACRLERGSGRRLIEYLSTHQLLEVAAPAPEELPTPDASELELLSDLATQDPASSAAIASEATIQSASSAAIAVPEPNSAEAEGAPLPPLQLWARLLGEAGVTRAGMGVSIAEYVGERLVAMRQRLSARDGDDPSDGTERKVTALDRLERALVPMLERLDALPERASWGAHLAALELLAQRALRRPELVLAVIAELGPLRSEVIELDLGEVVLALEDRLRNLEERSKARPYGRVLVTTSEGLRGRSRRVVLVPGLAERLFPQPVQEDPLLPDSARARLSSELMVSADRAENERLALRLALGAAREELYVSYPRLELEAGRPRVPSVYAMEIARGQAGHLPSADELDALARPPSRVSVLWPAPVDPELGIDESDYALGTIRRLRALPAAEARGRARFLVDRHTLLRRALITRFRRYNKDEYNEDDGLLWPPVASRGRLARFGLTTRAYSPSALEAYAACPYRFYLRGVLGLATTEPPEPLDRFDPRTYGDVLHACHARLTRRLAGGTLRLGDPRDREALAGLVRRVVEEEGQALARERAPLIAQVFADEMARIERDMLGYLEDVEARRDGFVPLRGDLSFGLSGHRERDPASVPEPVVLRSGHLLRGAVDSVERDDKGRLRITDFKTGRRDPEAEKRPLVIGGGEVLQPLLYALAVTQLERRAAGPAGVGEVSAEPQVTEARLYYATERGRYFARTVPVAPDSVARAVSVLEAIDAALKDGVLLVAPREEACDGCSYRAVCGPSEELRTARKRPASPAVQRHIERLVELRTKP